MIDDGKASCAFVSKDGCKVYSSRPGACRTYPLGRGAFLNTAGETEHIHVLLTEPHCKGFEQSKKQTIATWQLDQKINVYNDFNDIMLELIQHPDFINGYKLTHEQANLFMLTLYQTEEWLTKYGKDITYSTDEELLKTAIQWLKKEFFG